MKIFRYILILALAAFIIAARLNVNIGEWYAVTIYPIVSSVLSFSFSWIPFSMEEVLVIAAAVLIIATAVKGIRQRKTKAILSILEIIAWISIWFYLG